MVASVYDIFGTIFCGHNFWQLQMIDGMAMGTLINTTFKYSDPPVINLYH